MWIRRSLPPRWISRAARTVALCALAVLGLLLFTPPAAGAHNPDDEYEMRSVRAQSPHAADLIERGETLAVAGRVEEAVTLFRQAEAELPDSALPKRLVCEGMTALGRGPQALHSCYQSLQIARTNLAVRAVVRALVVGRDLPALNHVAEALMFASSERAKAPNHWVLSSAMCDIAERIGDLPMLEHCTSELVRLAPDAAETRQALALLDAKCPPLRFWVGWLVLGAAMVGTAAHVLRRWAARAARKTLPAVGAASVAVGLLLGGARPAHADEKRPEGWLTSWPINEDDPESSVPDEKKRNEDPLQFGYWLQDVVLKAEVYSKHGMHDKAIKFYRALAKAVPDRAVSFSHLCDEYEAVGDREKAIAACGAAVTMAGVTQGDYAHYVHLILAKPGSLTKQEEGFLALAIESLKQDPKAHPLVDVLECEVGTRTSNVKQLEECTAALAASAPNDLQTVAFQWALAMQQGKLDEARALLVRAKELGEKDEGVQSMQRAIDMAAKRKLVHVGLFFLATALLAAAAGILGRQLVRRRAGVRQPA
jgi:tetratricopeptide (TPR) repeat protein